MKKLIALCLLLATLLSLCACGEPSVENTDAPNNNQGQNGTPNKPADPTVAPTTVPPTTVPKKSDNVIAVEEKIAALGEITSADEATYKHLNEIQALYDALSAKEKTQVENYAKLEAAFAAYTTLRCEEEAKKIEEAINNMGEATYKNRQAVIDAMKLFKAASADVQAKVSNADELMNAAKTVAEKMMDKMAVEEDFVRNMAFYYHSQFPRGDEYWYADERCFSLPYLGKQGDRVWLRWICNYTDDDWVFFEKITFAVDDQRFYRYFSYYDVVRDNAYGDVWEYVDMEVGAAELEILEAIANSEKTVIRFEGDDYYNDFTVKAKDKEAIRFMLDLYLLLGGK